jgi:hypothetical protein
VVLRGLEARCGGPIARQWGGLSVGGGKELGAEFVCEFGVVLWFWVCLFLFVRSWVDDAQGGVASGVLLAGR